MTRILFLILLLVPLACGTGPLRFGPIEPPQPVGGECGEPIDVTLQVSDDCAATPVTLDRLAVTWPDGSSADIQRAVGDPEGVYRIAGVKLCEEHQVSASAAGYVTVIAAPVTFYEAFVAATLEPVGGCPAETN